MQTNLTVALLPVLFTNVTFCEANCVKPNSGYTRIISGLPSSWGLSGSYARNVYTAIFNNTDSDKCSFVGIIAGIFASLYEDLVVKLEPVAVKLSTLLLYINWVPVLPYKGSHVEALSKLGFI